MHQLFRFLRIIFVLSIFYWGGPLFAYVPPITKIDKSNLDRLFDQYISEQKLKTEWGYYFAKLEHVVDFLGQFVDLEELEFRNFPSSCNCRIDGLMKHPPYLPKLKRLTLSGDLIQNDLNWIVSYPLLESLTIDQWRILDVTPLQQMKYLTELNLLWGSSTLEIVHADCLPGSLKSLYLDDGEIDPTELNHLKLKKLRLKSAHVTTLPVASSLDELEDLDLSYSAITDLSAIEGNQSLRAFTYARPSKHGVEANFHIISTLSNLEELNLVHFPQTQKALENAMSGLTKLKKLTFTGQKIFDLSFLAGLRLEELSTNGRLLSLMPLSVLSNPSLTHLNITEFELADSDFSWKALSPNIRHLDLGGSEFCDFAMLSHFPLAHLSCDNVRCIDHEEQLIAFAPTLETLVCSGSTMYALIVAYGEEALASFVKLKKLNIDFSGENPFLTLNFLKKFPALEEVEVELSWGMPPEMLDVFLEMGHLKKIDMFSTYYEVFMKIEELKKKGVPIQ